ncbi:NUDIX hydrolase [Kitasatospora sp. CB01950]|uniref:NUDIX hydrolase n=1 Tax=Kitasatospora sp. CB01950 TaxID=1703930 RepID=UPI0009F8D411|nr:NUDIX hydrolase [Kitasatospora sp. CB01950]
MTHNVIHRRALEAAAADARLAGVELDGACEWLASAGPTLTEPFGAEVWVFDEDLARVLLVENRWRGLVPPGGRVEPGETPREGAIRELFEETGLRVEPFPEPAMVAVRCYRPGGTVTLGLSYTAVVDAAVPLTAESGQPVAWMSLHQDWESHFPGDPTRMRRHAERIARTTPG